jgi:hypothetical protein
MSRIFVRGLGAVSPAGWDVASLRAALERGEPLAVQPLARPGWEKPLKSRSVPNPAQRPAFLAHPRLRRTSPITHYAASAALEALAGFRRNNPGECPLGLVVCLQSGCVQFSYRFFDEALKDPATASPLLFPETVFAAPTSHVAALVENMPLVYTLMGDAACFLQGLALGAEWVAEGRVGGCLVIGAEESNWLLADALWHLEHAAVISGGAGALCLSAASGDSLGVELSLITDPHTYTAHRSRLQAARTMRQQFPPAAAGELLCDGQDDSPRTDAPEAAAWRDWTGPRLSPKRILGEGLMASPAWQCVAACDAVAGGRFTAANVSVVGANQQALGARFVRAALGISGLAAEAPAAGNSPRL